MAWDDGRPCAIPVNLREFDVASALRDLVEAGREKPSPYLAERQASKRHAAAAELPAHAVWQWQSAG